jgi:hypothetical protein
MEDQCENKKEKIDYIIDDDYIGLEKFYFDDNDIFNGFIWKIYNCRDSGISSSTIIPDINASTLNSDQKLFLTNIINTNTKDEFTEYVIDYDNRYKLDTEIIRNLLNLKNQLLI